MTWMLEFYAKQNQWSGVYEGEVAEAHRQKAALVTELTGVGPRRVLELGAGGGQVSAAMADLGHSVVAVELVPSLSAHARQLAASNTARNLTVVEADFYTVTLAGSFDIICYWDGFGIGTDQDQRRLLTRVAKWLAPTGSAFVEVSTPWYAAAVAGRGWTVSGAERRYGFDAEGCRWLDTWWPKGDPDQAVQQTLRCYSPADLRLLLEGTGLQLKQTKPGGAVDWEQGKWLPTVPLARAMNYVAHLQRTD